MMNKRVRTTLVFGLLSGLAFVPLQMAAGWLLLPGTAFRLVIAVLIGLYALLLARWGRAGRLSVMFPVLVLMAFAVLGTHRGFLILALLVLGWIRSGICFPGSVTGRILAEAVLGLGGGLLVQSFAPQTPVAWALGIWMFFLVQSLYFVLIAPGNEATNSGGSDEFEDARRRAEAILSGRRS
jgi:hypothetical protein